MALGNWDNHSRRAIERLLRKLLQYPKRPAVIMLGAFPHRFYDPGCVDLGPAPLRHSLISSCACCLSSYNLSRGHNSIMCMLVLHLSSVNQIEGALQNACTDGLPRSAEEGLSPCRQPHARIQEFYRTAEDEQVLIE